jgi:hypothetical protein
MSLSLVFALLLAGQAAPVQGTSAEMPKERLICRRETPIGSLIATRKVCLTKSQWESRARDGNEASRKMAYENMGRPSCNFNGGGDC